MHSTGYVHFLKVDYWWLLHVY